MAGKMNLERLTEEEKEKLREYVNSIKEIRKEIGKLVKKAKTQSVHEEGGNRSSGLELNI